MSTRKTGTCYQTSPAEQGVALSALRAELSKKRLHARSVENELCWTRAERKRAVFKNFEDQGLGKRNLIKSRDDVLKDRADDPLGIGNAGIGFLAQGNAGEIEGTRKAVKKMELRVYEALEIEDSDNYVVEDFGSKKNCTKIGISQIDIYANDKYRPKASLLPIFSNQFECLSKILSREDITDKVKDKTDTTQDNLKSKKIEPQQTLPIRFGLIDRSKQLEVYEHPIYTLYKEIPFLPSTYGESYSSETQVIESRLVKSGLTKSISSCLKVQRYFMKLETVKSSKKLASSCAKFTEKKSEKNIRVIKDFASRARKLNKEALSFWRKREKELTELKKREQKLEQDKKRKEEEQKEAMLQQKRLAFLMAQSDIYSHFMAKKLGIHNSSEDDLREENAAITNKEVAENSLMPNVEIDQELAFQNVQNIINDQRRKKEFYDEKKYQVTQKSKGRGAPKIQLEDDIMIPEDEENKERVTTDDLKQGYTGFDFSNVDIDNSSALVQTPSTFEGTLKEYQLKGLRWLDNLFEQGINGILADEMGLGKTIQAIALLAHLAEKRKNWGPFLVVAPNSTLFNWKNELTRFFPRAKVVPYWGASHNRKIVKKYFTVPELGAEDSKMHIVITSYNLAVQDAKTFHRVRWQYIILDEAQAIKNNASQRWTTLLSFKSRNKLLLTGTPIQNGMNELWALLHFIMPNLFDSLEQFKEWFSKDIESGSDDKKKLNQVQLNRLHAILKPFMLRRVKKDVEKELGKKTEYKILCEMTPRQRILYTSLKNRLSLNNLFDLIESGKTLYNLVMQLRKVCNHPEIFERRQFSAPFAITSLEPDMKHCPRTYGQTGIFRINWVNPIKFNLPTLVYHECYCLGDEYLLKGNMARFDIHSPSNTYNGSYKETGGFSFLYLLGLSGSEYHFNINEDLIFALLSLIHKNRFNGRKRYQQNYQKLLLEGQETDGDCDQKIENEERTPYSEPLSGMLRVGECYEYYGFKSDPFSLRAPKNISKLRDMLDYETSLVECYLPKVTSTVPDFYCRDTSFTYKWLLKLRNPLANYTFFGSRKKYPEFEWFDSSAIQPYMYERVPRFRPNMHYNGLLGKHIKHIPQSIMVPSFSTMIADSGKLAQLDRLLPKLKSGGHRVLIFCQMTKMLNIIEEYLLRKNYTYFRLDGNTNISDRDQMVQEYQTNQSIFAFILSTRAGGLGVTLTAADTVIFYDNDWNPTMDAQATDRAHRIGQTKNVSVYRYTLKD